jgi:hypothetical protein
MPPPWLSSCPLWGPTSKQVRPRTPAAHTEVCLLPDFGQWLAHQLLLPSGSARGRLCRQLPTTTVQLAHMLSCAPNLGPPAKQQPSTRTLVLSAEAVCTVSLQHETVCLLSMVHALVPRTFARSPSQLQYRQG